MEVISAPVPHASADGLALKQHIDVLWRRRYVGLATFGCVLAAGVGVILLSTPVYRTSTRLVVQVPSPTRSSVAVDPNNPVGALLVATQPPSVQAQVVEITSSLDAAEKQAGIQRRKGVPGPSVKVESPPNSDLISINVVGRDPDSIARLANTIADAHLQRTESWQAQGLERTIRFVRQERGAASTELLAARRKLAGFLQHFQLKQLTAEQEAQIKRYYELQAKVDEARSNASSAEAQLTHLRAQLSAEPVDLSRNRVQANPQRAELEERLRQLKVQRLELLEDFQPTSDPVQSVEGQIASFTKQLREEPESITVRTYVPNPRRDLLESKVTELEASLLQYQKTYSEALASFNARKGQVKSFGAGEVQADALTNERDRAQARYTMLTGLLQDLEIRATAGTQTARVIERAQVPRNPIWPRTLVLMAATLCLGLLLSMGAAFLQEFLDDNITAAHQVERLSALPTLAAVPQLGPGEAPRSRSLSTNPQAVEAYRALRAAVGFAALDRPLRLLQVTSPSEGDGKTTTAVNLATVLALDGKSVILVDADMRRPQIGKAFGLLDGPGLSELLAGSSTLDQAIRRTDVSNLSIVPAGAIPENPSELLGSAHFSQIVAELEQRADVVVFDTPPCVSVTDPVLAAGRMDGVVLVVNAGRTRKADVVRSLELLDRARARVIGTLFNRQKGSARSYYYSAARSMTQYVPPSDRLHLRERQDPLLQQAARARAADTSADSSLTPRGRVDRIDLLGDYLSENTARLLLGIEERLLFLKVSVNRLRSLLAAANLVGDMRLQRDLASVLDAAESELHSMETAAHEVRSNTPNESG